MLYKKDKDEKQDIEIHIERLAISEKKHNPYGRAFITVVELEPESPKLSRAKKRKYPIHRMPSLFYATRPIEKYYHRYPDADFENNIPLIGNTLAIKVSSGNWKEVVLEKLKLPNTLTIKYKKTNVQVTIPITSVVSMKNMSQVYSKNT